MEVEAPHSVDSSAILEEENVVINRSELRDSSSSTLWADIVEEEAKEKRLRKKEYLLRRKMKTQNEKKGREVFASNFVFDDLDSMHTKVREDLI